MINATTTPGHTLGLPEAPAPSLRAHIALQQNVATQLCGVLEALDILDNEDVAPGARTALINVALSMAIELNRNLDSVNLPSETK